MMNVFETNDGSPERRISSTARDQVSLDAPGGDPRAGPSKMAESVALIRARESRKPADELICYDAYAIHFIGRETLELMNRYPDRFKAEMDNYDRLMPGLANSLVARVRYFDEVVKASVEAGFRQLVILGSGYDTRAYRIEGIAGLRVFEVDHPDTVRAKREKIGEIFGALPAHVTYVPADLEVVKLGQRLEEAGYDRAKKTLFTMEGLLYYLPPEAVDALLAFVVRNSPRGSAVLFDYGRARVDEVTRADVNGRRFASERGEPLKSMIRGPIEQFLAARGFSNVRNLDSKAYHELYFTGKNAGREVYDVSAFAYGEV